MSYQNIINNIEIYNNLSGSKLRCVHHIIPRSKGGSDNIDNKISVTPSVHMFLHCMYDKENNTLTSTFFLTTTHKKLKEIKTLNDCLIYDDLEEEKRKAASEAQKKYWEDEEKRAYRIQQYSNAKKGRENVCKDRIWISNGIEVKRVYQDKFEEYEKQGFYKSNCRGIKSRTTPYPC